MVLLWGFAAAPVFRLADTPHASPDRVQTLDGLRGFLALSVFFYHGAVYHAYLLTGLWTAPPSRVFRLLGPFGVDIFFMITGYLFWSIMIKSAGRPAWLELYVGRVFRIGPLYLCAIAAALVAIFSHTGMVLHGSVVELMTSILELGMLGIYSMPPVNGYNGDWIVVAGVFWTLSYEWYFYSSLIFIAQAARHKIAHLALPGIAIALLLGLIAHTVFPRTMVNDSALICAALFCIGMVCASLRLRDFRLKVPGWLASTIVIALVGAAFTFFATFFAVMPILLLGIAFFFIVSGSDVFGLLSTIPARRLGNASFGIYLLQGLVLDGIFSIDSVKQFSLGSPCHYWEIVFLCGVILLTIAAVSYRSVEPPGIRAGQSASRIVRGWAEGDPRKRVTQERGIKQIDLAAKPASAMS